MKEDEIDEVIKLGIACSGKKVVVKGKVKESGSAVYQTIEAGQNSYFGHRN